MLLTKPNKLGYGNIFAKHRPQNHHPMRYLIVSILVSILSSFRTLVKMVHGKISKFVRSTSGLSSQEIKALS